MTELLARLQGSALVALGENGLIAVHGDDMAETRWQAVVGRGQMTRGRLLKRALAWSESGSRGTQMTSIQ